VRLGAGERCDALHEVEHRLRWPALLVEYSGDDLLGLGLGEAAFAQEALAVVVLAGDDRFPRGADAGDERRG